MNTAPQIVAAREETKAAVAEVNPSSPLVKPWYQDGTTLVSIAGILMTLSAYIPQIMDALPEGHELKEHLKVWGVLFALVGSILSKRSGVSAAADIHAAIKNGGLKS